MKRLHGRGQDSQDSINTRSAAAVEEMSHCKEFDYVVVNDDFETALDALAAVVLNKDARYTREAQISELTPLLARLLHPSE